MATWSAFAELNHPGDSIRERRTELGWTQTELAKRTGIPQADISRIENGRLDARWSTIQRISTALATTVRPRRRSLAGVQFVLAEAFNPCRRFAFIKAANRVGGERPHNLGRPD